MAELDAPGAVEVRFVPSGITLGTERGRGEPGGRSLCHPGSQPRDLYHWGSQPDRADDPRTDPADGPGGRTGRTGPAPQAGGQAAGGVLGDGDGGADGSAAAGTSKTVLTWVRMASIASSSRNSGYSGGQK